MAGFEKEASAPLQGEEANPAGRPPAGSLQEPMLGNNVVAVPDSLVSVDKLREARKSMSRTSIGGDLPTMSGDEGNNKGLVIAFVAMVVVGLGNKIFQKLQTIPMHNYANFLNLLTTFFYIPISFLYIIPMMKYGKQITPEQRAVPMKDFMVMGGLDSLAGIMQIFAATYLDGSLLILLTQSAIPISMFISYFLLSARYIAFQYAGSFVVACGICVVLVPRLLGSGGESTISKSQMLLWSVIMICSCVPMTLSSVYKEKALGATELDPVYLNGWIAVWQFFFSIPIAIVAAIITNPPVYPKDLPQNLYDGLKCYSGTDTVMLNSTANNAGFEVDDCDIAPLFVTVYLFFNVGYNVLIILILKYGSSNILWMAMTVMVPLGALAFSLPFVPESQPARVTDVIGLVVILSGLIAYRFGAQIMKKCGPEEVEKA